MTHQKYSYHTGDGAPLKLWDSAGAFEAGAMEQLHNGGFLRFGLRNHGV